MLARDRLGKKPLALRAACPTARSRSRRRRRRCCGCPGCRASSTWQQLDAYLALQYVPRSGLRAVEKVPPGSLAVAEGGAVRVERYWSPEPRPASASDGRLGRARARGGDRGGAAAARRRRAARRAPLGRDRLVDRRRGDGAGVARAGADVHDRLPRRSATTSASYARAVAERYGTRHEELEVDPGPELLDRARARPSTSRSATRRRCRRCSSARRRGGTSRSRSSATAATRPSAATSATAAHALAGRVPRVAAALGASALGAVPGAPGASRARRSSAPGGSSTSPRSPRPRATPGWSRCSRSSSAAALDGRGARAARRETLLPHGPDLRLVDIESYLPGDLLPKADIASMAVSLELRAPFLDHRVVELGLALPPRARLRQGRARSRRSRPTCRPRSPSRRKTGFGVPLDSWFRGELRAARRGAPARRRDRGLFRRAELERLLREHADRRADHGHRLWCLCMLELWQRRTSTPARRCRLLRDEQRVKPSLHRAPPVAVVVAACALPRLAALLHERAAVLSNLEKSSEIAHGVPARRERSATCPGEPSAYTQPVYGWFLVAVYWIARAPLVVARPRPDPGRGRDRRCSSTRSAGASSRRASALVAAVIATLQPYLIWHDIHGNREILDQLLGAARVPARAAGGRRHRSRATIAALGVVAGSPSSRTRASSCCRCSWAAFLLWRKAGWVGALAVPVLAVRGALAVGRFATRSRSAAGRSRPMPAPSGRRTTRTPMPRLRPGCGSTRCPTSRSAR